MPFSWFFKHEYMKIFIGFLKRKHRVRAMMQRKRFCLLVYMLHSESVTALSPLRWVMTSPTHIEEWTLASFVGNLETYTWLAYRREHRGQGWFSPPAASLCHYALLGSRLRQLRGINNKAGGKGSKTGRQPPAARSSHLLPAAVLLHRPGHLLFFVIIFFF